MGKMMNGTEFRNGRGKRWKSTNLDKSEPIPFTPHNLSLHSRPVSYVEGNWKVGI